MIAFDGSDESAFGPAFVTVYLDDGTPIYLETFQGLARFHTDGDCCGPGSFCCQHTGPHTHD